MCGAELAEDEAAPCEKYFGLYPASVPENPCCAYSDQYRSAAMPVEVYESLQYDSGKVPDHVSQHTVNVGTFQVAVSTHLQLVAKLGSACASALILHNIQPAVNSHKQSLDHFLEKS